MSRQLSDGGPAMRPNSTPSLPGAGLTLAVLIALEGGTSRGSPPPRGWPAMPARRPASTPPLARQSSQDEAGGDRQLDAGPPRGAPRGAGAAPMIHREPSSHPFPD